MSYQSNWLAKRLEGRLFVDEGDLCMVLSVDADDGVARVSRGRTAPAQVVEMSAEELRQRFNAGADLVLDGLNSPKTKARVREADEGWYFTTREGERGPWPSEEDARSELQRYIIAAQAGPVKDGGETPATQERLKERRRGFEPIPSI